MNRLALGCLLVLGAFGTPALADVRRGEVDVRLDSPDAWANDDAREAGFVFTAPVAGRLSRIEVLVAGTTRPLLSPADVDLARGESVRVRFARDAATTSSIVVLRYAWNGIAHEKEWDFRPGTESGRQWLDAQSPRDLEAPDSLANARDARPLGAFDLVFVRVHGRFVLDSPDRGAVAVAQLPAAILQVSGGVASTAYVTTTSATGDIDVTVPAWVAPGTLPTLKIRITAGAPGFMVSTKFDLTRAARYETKLYRNVPGDDLDLGVVHVTRNARELFIATTMARVFGWTLALGRAPDSLSVVVDQPANTASYYLDDTQWIHVAETSAWNTRTLAHEFAHHWMHRFSPTTAETEYCNGVCDGGSTGDCGHKVWCPENLDVAWSEGFSNWLAEEFLSYWRGAFLAEPPGDSFYFEAIVGCASCGLNGTIASPDSTEGIAAAFLWDLVDAQPDPSVGDDGRWTGLGADRVTLPLADLLVAIDQDNPTSARELFGSLKSRYPTQANALWKAGALNHLDYDEQPPSAPTGLTTVRQVPNTPTNDRIIRLTWTPSTDDASGVRGYSVVFSSTPVPPEPPVINTYIPSWTSPPQPPGTTYCIIRTIDWAGRASAPLVAGPYLINAPGTSDLAWFVPPGWRFPVVPRTTGGATTTSCAAPTTLPWNSLLYLNYALTNLGPSNAAGTVQAQYLWNGGYIGGGWTWPGCAVGVRLYDLNDYVGAWTSDGQRVTLGYIIDDQANFSEPNEDNNQWARQWVWSPRDITTLGLIRKKAPWPANWGHGAIPAGEPAEANCTGFRITPTAKWDAVTLLAQDVGGEFDLGIYSPTTNDTTGFSLASQIVVSETLGDLEAVIINKLNPYLAGQTQWDVGVLNPTGNTSRYWIENVPSQDLPFATYGAGTLPDTSSLRLYAVDFPPGQGIVSVVVQITDPNPKTTPLKVLVASPASEILGIAYADAYAMTDTLGYARIDVPLLLPGSSAIAVYREPGWGYNPVHFTVVAFATRPDIVAYAPPGWWSPLVPLDNPGGTDTSVPPPIALLGDQGATYINLAVTNITPAPAPAPQPGATRPLAASATGTGAAVTTAVRLDGVTLTTATSDTLWGGASQMFHLPTPFVVTGGRHTLTARIDTAGLAGEMSTANNTCGDTWVWTPATLPVGGAVVRGAPPDRVGGWDEVTAEHSGAFNCDGLRLPAVAPAGQEGHWLALAATAAPLADVDLDLYEACTGARAGFDSSLACSFGGTGETDYVLVNGNLGVARPFDVGITRGGGNVVSGYYAQVVSSAWLGAISSGTLGPFTLGAAQLLALHEAELPPGRFLLSLENVSGTIDWGLTVHDPTIPFGGRDSALAGGESWLGGAGATEDVSFTLPAGGRTAIAVWKANAADLDATGSYRLLLSAYPLAVDGPAAPAVTALLGARPNPAADAANVAFALAHAGEASVAIYDVRGALVRTLCRGTLPAGRHEVRWDGRDARGRRAPGGVYFVRLDAGGARDVRKLVRL